MSQGIRSFKFEQEKELTNPISLADLPVPLYLVNAITLVNTHEPFAMFKDAKHSEK
ncbi:hypothetical protein [uncultured Desulfobacter sp.]|uniref:hypothetical protein n=1 Tax=uncultured Desulfobacter sp. TaxID=240139 RepID=UPI0029F576BB|nr:hypothetical protein [uncultured Desulfobacter sp.]